MTYRTVENITDANLIDILKFPTTDTALFWPIILFTIFIILTLSSFFRELRREGKGNIVSSLAVAGFVTTVIALIMSLIGIIQRQVVVYALVISLVFGAIYFLTKRKGA